MSATSTEAPPPPPHSLSAAASPWRRPRFRRTISMSVLLLPVIAGMVMYHMEPLEPAAFPVKETMRKSCSGEAEEGMKKNGRILQLGAEFVGWGDIVGPEDIAYDSKSGLLYTGCVDGWIKRIKLKKSLNDTVVDRLVNTGGRPLGLVLGPHNNLIVADAYKGLLNVSRRRKGGVKLLTNRAEGLMFNLTDGVDMAGNGKLIYFTDASHKYNLDEFIWDILEGKPHGRLLSFDPSTRKTKVLARNLYFPNGVALSPDQLFLVFCETPLRWCRKYYIRGKKKGTIEKFVQNLPGLPDNIHFRNGHYWIGMAAKPTVTLELAWRYPMLRKIAAIITRYIGRSRIPNMKILKDAGVLVVDTKGKAIAHYYDPELAFISSGINIGHHLYCGSLMYPYILRLNLTTIDPSSSFSS